MNQEQIDRINALYRKSKAEGLTEGRKREQALLRKQYVADVKKNLAAQQQYRYGESGRFRGEPWR